MNAQLARARAVVAEMIPTLSLPAFVPVQSELWRQHVSYRGAMHWKFELPATDEPTDYERLEVCAARSSTDARPNAWVAKSRLTRPDQQHVGDALLSSEVALLIHELHPKLVVGARALLKSVLVENLTLSQIATAYGLPSTILTSAAQCTSIQSNPMVQACVFEAYLAVLYDEHGPTILRDFLRAIYEPVLQKLVDELRPLFLSGEASAEDTGRNWVGRLGEWAAQKGAAGRKVHFGPPDRVGPSHAPEWRMQCHVELQDGDSSNQSFQGTASSLARAKSMWAYSVGAEYESRLTILISSAAQQACEYLSL